MKTSFDIYYQAVVTRDSRFDGKFFLGVKTTGIYCRPICPAKPKRENIEFFQNAHSAEKRGYRPCLRCRPESAPNSPVWMGKNATVQRALKMISNHGLHENNENDFAELLGVSARHLRRLFEDELGKTPKQISDANRLNFARKLISETAIPVTEIAFTSGFSSIRRFNEAFKTRFHRAPSELRKLNSTPLEPWVQLKLSYRPPFDWESLLHFYQSHEVSGVEEVSEESYSRVFKIDGVVGAFSLTHSSMDSTLNLRIASSETKQLYRIVQNVRQMLDLDSDPILISEVFSVCKTLSELVRKNPGLRLSRGWDPYESAIWTILGQLVSVKQAKRLVKQVTEAYGEEIQNPLTGKKAFLFPSPETLAEASLSEVGTTQIRKQTIREFSRLVTEKKINLDLSQDLKLLRQKLLEIRGIGPWSAECICLRALGDTDSFPASDLILKRALKLHPEIKIEKFKPWRGYAAIYLWKEYA